MGIHYTGGSSTESADLYYLQQDAVHAVADSALVPLDLARVLLALVEQQRLQDVRRDGAAGQVQVLFAAKSRHVIRVFRQKT